MTIPSDLNITSLIEHLYWYIYSYSCHNEHKDNLLFFKGLLVITKSEF